MMIKQRVNLYQPVLYVQRQRLTLARLMLVWLALIAVVTAVLLILQQQQRQQSAIVEEQQRQLQTVQQEISLYQQALAQRQPSPALQKQHQLLQHSVLQKQNLLSYLSGQQQQRSLFYSPVLQHLQQINRSELWLTEFSLQQQHSSFAGIALKPEAVPLWLADLRRLEYFRGQRFSQISLQQVVDKQAVSFVLTAQQGVQP